MNKHNLNKFVYSSILLCLLVTALIANEVEEDKTIIYVDNSIEMSSLTELGLSSDVTDGEIVQLLDEPSKCIPAISLIRYRRISSAIPKLVEIVKQSNISANSLESMASFLFKLNAAEALCDFGNKEWIEPVKKCLDDSNNPIPSISYQIRIVRLLAREGDYSYFNIVSDNINNEQSSVRSSAVYALGYFNLKENMITDQAASLLETVAISDSDEWVRKRAIESLEEIAKNNPGIIPKVIIALEANLNSRNHFLHQTCKTRLEVYRHKLMTDEEVIKLLDNEKTFVVGAELAQQRKLQSAASNLLEVLHRKNTDLYKKYIAARTLMELDNKDWIEPIKNASNDPNVYRSVSQRLWLIALMVQGGDYSQFEVVEGYLGTSEINDRHQAIRTLAFFGQRSGQIATRAIELLEATAVGDSDTNLRNSAIVSLEKIVEEKPEMKSSLIRAYEANLNSENRLLKSKCEAGLKKYRDKPEQ